MNILAKSILNYGQLEARKRLNTPGVELLLLEKDFQDLTKTKDKLVRIAEEWPIIALEAPDSTKTYPINPFSDDIQVSRSSNDFLLHFVDLANYVNERTGKIAYAQFQYLFDRFGSNGLPKIVDREEQLAKIKDYYEQLRRNSQVKLQIENIIPINPAHADGSLRYCYTTIRPSDFALMDVPMALDVIHLAQTFYTWLKAQDEKDGLCKIKIPALKEFNGGIYIQMSEEDKVIREKIANDVKEVGLREAVTSELIAVIQNYNPLIGSLQFANAEAGFGAFPGEDGVESDEGMINIGRLFREAIIPANVPYVIPEYNEEDYTKPINQQKVIELIQKIKI